MIAYLKKLVRENFHGFTFFYQYLGWRVFALFVMSFLVGLFDGFSLALFMPLLELIGSEERLATGAVDQLGSLSFLTKGFDYIGVPMRASYILLAIFILLAFKAIFNFLGTYIGAIFQQKLIRKIRIENVDKVQNLDYKVFVGTDAGKIQNSLSTEVDRVNSSFSKYITVLQLAVQIFVYASLAFLANPQFALLVIVGSIISNRVFNVIYNATKRASSHITDIGHSFHGLLIQFVAHFKYLKATGLAVVYSRKLAEEIKNLEVQHRKLGFLTGIVNGIREPLAIGVVIFIILVELTFFGGSLSAIVLSVLFLYRALTQVMNIQTAYNGYLQTSGSLNNLIQMQQFLDSQKEKDYGAIQSSLQSKIRLKDVSFSYGSREVLSEINLTIERNKTTALIGESGSGKTTLMNIIAGLLRPNTGTIYYDGINSNEFDYPYFRTKIGYITQEAVVFDDTIFNNISFWADRTKGNERRCYEALQKAALSNLVDDSLLGLDTRLGNNGVSLSGGQRQRISIARELYKDIELLLLDEATSSLDSETESIIQKNVNDLKGEVTTIIIAHRLSTTKKADNIVLLRNGRLDLSGSHDELLEMSELYKRMVEKQTY